MKDKKTVLYIGVVIVMVIFGGSIFFRSRENPVPKEEVALVQEIVPDTVSQVPLVPIERKAVVYRSLTCGCCMGYIAELEKQGFVVDVKSLREKDIDAIKKQYGIPLDKQSCHTTIIGDYFIEGHVPIEAVEKLLAEQPKIDGIGLPGMPLGTPGMPGTKQSPYKIYEKVGSKFSEFMTL